MRELLYLSTAKLGEFHQAPTGGLSARAFEAEASVLGAVRARVSVGEGSAGEGSPEARLEQVLTHIQAKLRAHTSLPNTCEDLKAYDWLEFTGPFLYGPRVRDWGLINRGVYTFMSLQDPLCALRRGEEMCSGVELILCGSRQHVRMEHDCPPTRMGSGSDWLHDLAAELVGKEESGDTSFPDRLLTTNRSDQEFAARSSYSMLASYCEGPAYLHGHARVLCNFSPGQFQHRLIVATPLYVEAVPPPEPATATVTAQPTIPPARWRRLLQSWGKGSTSR
ncbi:SAVMC3_10250 family protein [Streptomyces olivoreticuli]